MSTHGTSSGQPLDTGSGLPALQLVASPRAPRLLARILLALLGCMILGLTVAPWQQNITASGRVIAFEPADRQQTIAAPVMGRVRQTWVVEGSVVDKGDRLLEIVDNDPEIIERLQRQREAILAKLEAVRAKARSYFDQVASLDGARNMAITAAENQVLVAVAKVRSEEHGLEGALAAASQARLNFERQKELFAEGLASRLEFELAERSFREAEAKVAQARQALEAARKEEASKRADLGKVNTEAQAKVESARAEAQTAEGDLANEEKELAAIDVRITQQNTQLVVAPRDGTVFRMFANPGAELVKVGDPLLILVPDTASRAVELWVDGNHVPLLRKGRPVRLQFEGWPAVQFGGWPSVAVGTFGGRLEFVDPTDDGKGRFRTVALPDPEDDPWPEPRFLRQGVRVNAFILLDQVSLGYEIWRQWNGFPPTVMMEGGEKVPKVGK